MASKFYAGMKNVVEVLNQMWDAFAAGPYNALPLTGGQLTGAVASTANITARNFLTTGQVVAGVGLGASSVRSPNDSQPGVAGQSYEVAALGVAGIAGFAYPGRFYWSTLGGAASTGVFASSYQMVLRAVDSGPGSVPTGPLMTISGSGYVNVQSLQVGPFSSTSPNVIGSPDQVQGNEELQIINSALFSVCSGPSGNLAPCGVRISSNTVTGRSINAGGTINASGADYAEYLIKAVLCGTIAPGQIVGIDAEGRLADKWDCAITFMVKSSNPCMVGGDSWAQDLGARPVAPARVLPSIEQEMVSPAVPADPASGTDAVAAVFRSIVTAPGDSDAEWAAKEEAHSAALAAFDTALEQRRQTVDRIAFAGQVPVNVLGATPGQYIVPVQDGEGIAGHAVDRGDMTLDQYMSAIGRVIAIEDDGRARIIVKVA